MLTNCTPNLRYAMVQSLFLDFLSLLLAKQESELSESKEPQNTSKKYQLLWRVFCSGFKKCHYKSHIAVLFRTALVHEIYCGVHLARHNRSTLLQRTTVVANKTATIYIYQRCWTQLQRHSIKPLQYIHHFAVYYSGGT